MDKRLITILLIVFVQMLGASMAMPILPLFAQSEFEMSPEIIALLFSAFFAAQFFAGPYIGRLSDRYGRVPVLIISQIGTVLSFIMIGSAQSIAVLFVARILDGVTGGNLIVAQAYVTDITPREKRTEALGIIFAAFGAGFIFGPVLGGLLSAEFGARIPFYVAAVAAAVVVLITWFNLDESVSAEQQEAEKKSEKKTMLDMRAVLANRPLIFVLVIAFVGQFGLGMLQTTFSLFAEAVLFVEYSAEVTARGIGILFACVGVSQILAQGVVLPRLLRRFDEVAIIIVGNVLRTIGSVIFAVVFSPWLAGVGTLFFALGMGLITPPLQSLSAGTVADKARGEVFGLFQSTVNLSTIISTAIAGVLYALSPRMPYWVAAVMTLAVIPIAFLLYRFNLVGAKRGD